MVNKVVTWGRNPVNLTCIAQAIPNATIVWYMGSNVNQLDKFSRSNYVFYTKTGQSTVQVRGE